MFPTYLIALAVAIIAIGVFLTATEDISVILAAGVAFVFLIWGFALAPWQLQLLLVVILLSLKPINWLKEQWLE